MSLPHLICNSPSISVNLKKEAADLLASSAKCPPGNGQHLDEAVARIAAKAVVELCFLGKADGTDDCYFLPIEMTVIISTELCPFQPYFRWIWDLQGFHDQLNLRRPSPMDAAVEADKLGNDRLVQFQGVGSH